ncbi:MAG: energy transducer TonB [Spirosomataceae bacterium]
MKTVIFFLAIFSYQISFAQNNTEPIFTAVEVQPEFPGGPAAMYKYLGMSIVYPKEAQKANISGRVFVRFIVRKDGTIDNVEVLKGIGFGCDAEAARVIKAMPKWTPGYQNGKAVNVYYNMPIVYKLDNGRKTSKLFSN